jgi:hypothetical protein
VLIGKTKHELLESRNSVLGNLVMAKCSELFLPVIIASRSAQRAKQLALYRLSVL